MLTALPPPACQIPGAGAERVGRLARAALLDELSTWPKPGLVSHVDAGSHADMDADTFERSAAAIAPFFTALARAGEAGADMPVLRGVGLAAERAMMRATGGVNTHRGAIFALGLLCAAEGASGYVRGTAAARAGAVAALWGEAILAVPASPRSHGGAASLRFAVGGARGEAARGFPTVLRVGLPALRSGRVLAPGDPGAARVQCFFALLAEVHDTNLLHRGGAGGLRWAKDMAAAFLAAGGVGDAGWEPRAAAAHRAFVARTLSPGGAADLLAATLLLDALEPAEGPTGVAG